MIEMLFSARHLKRMDIFGRSDPYLVVKRKDWDGEETELTRTEFLLRTLDPDWGALRVHEHDLCDCDWDAPITLTVWDYDVQASDDIIGFIPTTLNEIIRIARYQEPLALLHPRGKTHQDVGSLYCRFIQVEEYPPSKMSDKGHQFPDVGSQMELDEKLRRLMKFMPWRRNTIRPDKPGKRTKLVWPAMLLAALVGITLLAVWTGEVVLWALVLNGTIESGEDIARESRLCGECRACARYLANIALAGDSISITLKTHSETLRVVMDTCVMMNCGSYCFAVTKSKNGFFTILFIITAFLSYICTMTTSLLIIEQMGYPLIDIFMSVRNAGSGPSGKVKKVLRNGKLMDKDEADMMDAVEAAQRKALEQGGASPSSPGSPKFMAIDGINPTPTPTTPTLGDKETKIGQVFKNSPEESGADGLEEGEMPEIKVDKKKSKAKK